ncbi:MAG: DegT/DnrJ/EryC1/StrS family aminotransferase [Candidatus Latescibacteria bacterium]|nr:DegT/DnrJ/EryC1/StrS family aminotransferase [Candidatus Latescibacterota bacterium]
MSAQKLAALGGRPVRTRPWPEWPVYDERELNALKEVLESRKWCRMYGQKVEQFEEAFARYQDARYGIAVANGTAALEIALKAAGIEAGDEVIVPAYTFIATATAPLQLSAIPIFVDIDPDTGNIDPSAVEAAITGRTRAVVPVHFGGRAADMDRILEIAQRHGLTVIEDACHGWGSTWKGRKLGAIGLAGGVSFQQSKNITAGEGGIILTNDEEMAGKCYSLQTIGRVAGRPFYEHHLAGWNYRMTEWQGALLLVQLERLEAQTQTRWDNARFLDEQLKAFPCVRLLRQDPWVTRSSVHVYMARYGEAAMEGIPRDRFLKALNAEGVPAGSGYPHPLYRNPLFTEMHFGRKGHPYTCAFYGKPVDYAGCDCPAAERFCRENISIFQNVLLGDREDMQDIVRAVEKVWENREMLKENA